MLRIKDFYPRKESINGLVDLIKICFCPDTIIDEEIFSKLNDLEHIINVISENEQVYSIISKIIHPIVLEAILRWSNRQFNGSNHVQKRK